MITFKQFLQEKVLNIGFNSKHEQFREKHRQQIHDIIRSSYSKINGYAGLGSGSEEESKAIHDDISKHNLKAIKRGNNITAVRIYKDSHGRKSIISATDGSPQGKSDFAKLMADDTKLQRSWGEVSGAMEHIHGKLNTPVVPADRASQLLGKPVEKDVDGYHYKRMIAGKPMRKVIVGFPKG